MEDLKFIWQLPFLLITIALIIVASLIMKVLVGGRWLLLAGFLVVSYFSYNYYITRRER